jgi:hypothetical protein
MALIEFKYITGTQIKILVIILTIAIVPASLQLFTKNKIMKEGVYIKGTVLSREGYKGGVISKIKYTFKGRVYENNAHSEGGDKVGGQYFIKILASDPDELILLANNPVPECLLNSSPPVEGWAQIPECR